MKTYILNLDNSESLKLVYQTTFLQEVSNICAIPEDTEYLKVVGTIDFEKVIFDEKFYSAFKGKVKVFDLSELKSSSSYHSLRLSLNDGSKNYYGQSVQIEEIILPNELESMPMIRNIPKLRKIIGLGLSSFNNECLADCHRGSNLSRCPKLEEIEFGFNIKILSIRNSLIKKIHIPDSNSSLRLEPYALAYNKRLEEIHIPRDMKELPIRLFEGCDSLKTITGGNSVEKIGFGAFGGCINLYSVPFKIELLREDQFVSYDEWMQYAPIGYIANLLDHGDCEHCPIYRWPSIRRNTSARECLYSIKSYCRDNDLIKWKPYKKGVVLKNGYIWCFDDSSYYKIAVDAELNFWGESINAHRYVEFIAPSITFIPNGGHVVISYDSPKNAIELTYPNNKLTDMIDLYYKEISYEVILEEITQKVEGLDIEAIIDSYETISSYNTYKWSDTERERYTIDRDAKYTDEYLARLLPPIHEHHDDSKACVVNNNYNHYNINPNKRYDFESCLSTFGKQGRDIFGPYHRTGNILRDIDNLKNKDEDVRKEARRKYNKKDHIDFLVNSRISELINKKLEIESRLHIKQAENEFTHRAKGAHK